MTRRERPARSRPCCASRLFTWLNAHATVRDGALLLVLLGLFGGGMVGGGLLITALLRALEAFLSP